VSHPLVERLRNADPEERRAACLAARTDPAAALLADALGKALGDSVKAVARAASDALVEIGRRDRHVDGVLREALRSDCDISAVFAAESVRSAVSSHVRGLKKVQVTVLPDDLFRSISATESSQGVMALVRPPRWTVEQVLRGHSLAIVLDGVQDPGNAGSILRAAEAFGATGAVFLKGTVSPYNPKCLRASAGSVFRVPLVPSMDPQLLLAAAEQRKLDLFALMPKGALELGESNLTRKCAIIVGSEGRGVSERLRAKAMDIRIPTAGVESLNAALAAGIALYIARKQRMAVS
jgi:TrmH family RNA methyltransferase